ncbi:MAG TPA: energy transducer TonB [Blastocatellia bacterium]|nr:energy transducer TonB [Blastocatellia bacterium]
MNAFNTAIALMALLIGAPQDLTLESKAVTRVQQTPSSQYDPALPGRPIGNWLNQIVGPQSGVSWRLGECIEQGAAASAEVRDIPACVEATAILPDDRKIVAQFFVGFLKQGLSEKTRFHFATIENDNQFQSVSKLSDLPQLLRAPFPVPAIRIATLPDVKAIGTPKLYLAKAPALIDLPMTLAVDSNAVIPPPPKRAVAPKVSKGVSVGDAIIRVMPVYPGIARQINASGDVQVTITIDENGRVIEAKAISGHPVLRSAAEDAAKKWVFKPTLLDGSPVRQQGVLTFIFSLPQ